MNPCRHTHCVPLDRYAAVCRILVATPFTNTFLACPTSVRRRQRPWPRGPGRRRGFRGGLKYAFEIGPGLARQIVFKCIMCDRPLSYFASVSSASSELLALSFFCLLRPSFRSSAAWSSTAIASPGSAPASSAAALASTNSNLSWLPRWYQLFIGNLLARRNRRASSAQGPCSKGRAGSGRRRRGANQVN